MTPRSHEAPPLTLVASRERDEVQSEANRPTAPRINVDGIPEEMKLYGRWVVWKLFWAEKRGKWTKVPFIATSPAQRASSTDPKTWHAFDHAVAAYEQGKCDGIGFVLGDGWTGFDADGTDATEHLRLLNTYSERSPSGRGVHAIARGKKPGTQCRDKQYELYDKDRYFTVTGDHIEGFPTTVEERTDEIAELYSLIFKTGNDTASDSKTPTDCNQGGAVESLPDEQVLERARTAKNGKKFTALLGGDCSSYGSQSEADMALCCHLAFWCRKDPVQIDRLFQRSLLMRAKWNERHGDRTYGQMTIDAAIAQTKEVYGRASIDGSGGIVMRGGDLPQIVDQAEAALLKLPIYQRGGVLTRAIKLEKIRPGGAVRRDTGSTVLIPVTEPWLTEQMGRAIRWFTYNESKDKLSPADPSAIYARTLLNRGEWRLPTLRAVVTAPTLASDGRIISEPGFDAASGLLVDTRPNGFPPVPTNPTQDDAAAALYKLCQPLRGFPFVDDAAKAVALSALLTALIRPSLDAVPLHGFDAPMPGSGKSLLAEMVGLLATGYLPPAMNQGGNEEEDEKRLSAIQFSGDPVIHIDNCERNISGAYLCSMLTQPTTKARILGQSTMRELPSTAVVLASGNNLTFAGDVTRRVVICRVNANIERPDMREFDFDCHEEVRAQRAELVVAGLTVLRAYHMAERVKPRADRTVRITPMGSFTGWEWVRGALMWLGHPDPADTRTTILDNDPRRDELTAVMDLWDTAFGDRRVEVAEIATGAERNEPSVPDSDAEALCNKFIEVTNKPKWNGKSVGWWLNRHKDRVTGGRCFRCEKSANRQSWWLAGGQRTPEEE